MRPSAATLAATLLLALGCGTPAVPDSPVLDPVPASPTLMVLDFANRTGDSRYEPLGKGLADMMLTDLARHPGLAVVERDRMAEILAEQSLQHTGIVDAQTAVELGKAIGASHAVTGSITAFEPDLRLDVRLVDVATAKVVLATEVTGPSDRFFALQADLSARFVAQLPGVQDAPAMPDTQTTAGDVLDYGVALDQADRGDFDGASKSLADLVQRRPGLTIAADRYEVALRQMLAAKERRAGLLGGEAATLRATATAHLQGIPAERRRSGRDLGYRILLGQMLEAELRAMASQEGDWLAGEVLPIVPGPDRPHALRAARALAQNHDLLAIEIGAYSAKQLFFLDIEVPRADRDRARSLDISSPGSWPFLAVHSVRRANGRLLCNGMLGSTFVDGFAPAPARMDPALGAAALEQFTLAEAAIPAHHESRDDEISRVRLDRGECLLALGRQAEALATWQGALDAFPTSDEFVVIERRMHEVLGAD